MNLPALIVYREYAELARQKLIELELLHKSARIQREGNCICLPLTNIPGATTPLPPHKIKFLDFEETKQQRKTVEDLLGYTPSFDTIGDIAILNTPSPDSQAAAEAILSVHKNINCVFLSSAVSGEFRTRPLTHLCGENRTETHHREHGRTYKIDVTQAYFTPRLATERKRIVDKIQSGVVVDMFAGVGPFSILIAKKNPHIRVVALDKNKHAIAYLKYNIYKNKTNNIDAILADSAHMPIKKNAADTVIMNLPHSASHFLEEAMHILKHQGVMYFYDITPADDLYHSSERNICSHAEDLGFEAKIINRRIVRSYSPHQFNICIEAKLHKPGT